MKILTNSFVLLISILLFTSCEAQSNKGENNSNKQQVDSLRLISDSVFISRINALSMVKSQEKKIGTLDYVVKNIPTKENPYYIIQVGKSNNNRLEIFYNFYCYPKTGELKYYDTLKDTLISPQ